MSVVQDFVLKYLGATVAVVLIIGPFFGEHLRPMDNVQGRAHMLSNMRYHTSVVIYLFGALGTMGASSRKLMRLSAYADRIADMQRTVKGLSSSAGSKFPTSFGKCYFGPHVDVVIRCIVVAASVDVLGTMAASARKLLKLSANANKIADMQRTVMSLSSSAGSMFAYTPCEVQALVDCRLS